MVTRNATKYVTLTAILTKSAAQERHLSNCCCLSRVSISGSGSVPVHCGTGFTSTVPMSPDRS